MAAGPRAEGSGFWSDKFSGWTIGAEISLAF
jgi:hypothetical protein